MRTYFTLIFCLAVALTGCAGKKTPSTRSAPRHPAASPPPAAAPSTNQTQVVRPENALAGKVALVNPAARFVVLSFPFGRMAAIDNRLTLYRRGVKVGEVKITGPARENTIVADLVAGKAEVGDEARNQ